MKKINVKREPWLQALISACCGVVLCFLAGCFFTWLGKMIYIYDLRLSFRDIEFSSAININDDKIYQWYYEYVMIYQIRFLVCQIFSNLLLIVIGILTVRFRKSIKKFRGRRVFLAIPLILEILTVIITFQSYRYNWNVLLRIPWIVIIIHIIIVSVLVTCIRVFKIRTYVIYCILAVLLSVPCTLFTIRAMYGGSCAIQEMMAVTFILQPFSVFFPIISLIKGVIFTSEIGDASA